MKFRLAFVLVFISIFSFAQTIDHVLISGSSFYMIPPSGFEPANGFKGYMHKSTGALIMVNDIEAPYSKVLDQFSKEALEKKDMKLVGRQDAKVNNADATLITATQLDDGIENFKKFLLFGDGQKTLLVTAIYPESNPELAGGIKRALLSTVYKQPESADSESDNLIALPLAGGYGESTEYHEPYNRRVWTEGERWIAQSSYGSGEREMIATYLNEDLTIREGLCRRWYKNGTLADSTYYVNDKLEGHQTWFFENGQKSEEGTYVAGAPKAVTFRTEDGTPDPKGVSGVQMPSFKGEQNGLLNYLNTTLSYPESARKRDQEGKVYIQFVITAQGKIIEPHVSKSSGVPALDDEALRVIRMMPDWNPATDHNRRKEVIFTMPLTFRQG